MKKILLLVFIIVTSLTLWSNYSLPQTSPESPLSFSNQADPLTQMNSVIYQDKKYLFSLVVIKDLTRLQLFSNANNMDRSSDLIKKHHCSILVNGGFYDTDDEHIGWLVSQGKTLSSSVISNFFNGYLSIDNSLSISAHRPKTTLRLGLQSGPLLILDSKPLHLTIKDDQSRRRLIALKNDQQQLVFVVITGPDSQFSGPLLADTPALLKEIQKLTSQTFVDAINLDGGSASAFFTQEIYLEEFSPIGSYFCYN